MSKALQPGSMNVLITFLLYIAEQCYDKIQVNYLDTVLYVDPITRQTFEDANQIPCEKTRKNLFTQTLINIMF